ncbi:DNA-binding response regulator [Clostridium tetani]|uniref:Stage 0 sporulation protein A homolog n=1 Tax=Clostridium tetani TaxID=1513 RepID=A0A4Q0VF65_CLOTA|nr:response regulator [Clostridium tetani]RXI49911.1 DNA-binding response regulator [Clostridium tetani]BDR67617.1 DNA-binding response regulator [Clostridium tetani]BDR73007.1 DNA-binding response regulator [Clostridium tetani]BDR81550.1 DNA-binding response regulator [Clostridium tetani]BDR89931.1 DNA-binding response regulator [Clostridium tetani]
MFRIVIADDEDTIRNGLKNLIESYELNLSVIATAKDGEEAIKVIEEYHPEIILMDINMPFMNGLEVIKSIREKNKDAKIIIISGYNQFEYAQKALELGVFNYLLKPINYRDFKNILIKAMDSYSRRMWEISKIKEGKEKIENCKDVGNLALSYIKENFSNNEISLNLVAQQFYISQSYLTRVIKQKTGVSFTDYLNKLRINMAKKLLTDSNNDYTINDISSMVGYSSQHYFSRAFKNYMEISPKNYRNKEKLILKNTTK